MNEIAPKPFLKWAGGKRQLLPVIKSKLPNDLGINIKNYVEPFIGGGAVLFDILSQYDIETAYISDINPELINCYVQIKDNVNQLILILDDYANRYLSANAAERSQMYYEIRDEYNSLVSNTDDNNKTLKAALFIFLNKTCFNGLYRVNRNGFFNVPEGKYKNPKILDKLNLENVSKVLQKVTITTNDFQESENAIDSSSFVYFDPPYRPLTKTANFTSYSSEAFDDESQIELSKFFRKMNGLGAKLMLSNSDPKNIDSSDEFFDDLYEGFNIERITAKRSINSNATKRGAISELLITNYERNSYEKEF